MALRAERRQLSPGLGIRFGLHIMSFHRDLFVPFGPGWVCLMASQAGAVIALIDFDVRVVSVSLPGTVASFAGKGFMFEF